MTPFDMALEHAEDLAEAGDFAGALAALESTRLSEAAEGRATNAAAAQVEVGAMTARAGDLEGALPVLELAEASARAAGAPLTALEARVTHCSVLGALAQFDRALPALKHAVAELESIAPGSELHQQAAGELRSFTNLTSPKNAATWASLLET